MGDGEDFVAAEPLSAAEARYERRADIHQAFLELGCALICRNHVKRSYYAHLATLGKGVLRSVFVLPTPFLGAALQGLELRLQVL